MRNTHRHMRLRLKEPGFHHRFVLRDARGAYVELEGWRFRHPALEPLVCKAVRLIAHPNGRVLVRDLFAQICEIDPGATLLGAGSTADRAPMAPGRTLAGLLGQAIKRLEGSVL